MERTFTVLIGSRHGKHSVPVPDWWVNRGREYFLTKAKSKKLVFNSQLEWVHLFHPPPAVHRENLVLDWVAPGLARKFEKQFCFWPSQNSPSTPPQHAIYSVLSLDRLPSLYYITCHKVFRDAKNSH